jgi:hypothetical protein
MYRLSTVSASQLNLAMGTMVIERTANPITASGTVMTSSSLLRYSNAEAANHAIQTTALTSNVFSRASTQSCLTTLFTTEISSPLATAKINKPQKNWSRFMSRDTPFAKPIQPAGLTELLTAVATFTCVDPASGAREAS